MLNPCFSLDLLVVDRTQSCRGRPRVRQSALQEADCTLQEALLQTYCILAHGISLYCSICRLIAEVLLGCEVIYRPSVHFPVSFDLKQPSSLFASSCSLLIETVHMLYLVSMAQRTITLVLLLALSAQLAFCREFRRPQRSVPRQNAGYGDLDSLLKAVSSGKLDIQGITPKSKAPAQTPAQQPELQQPPQVPNIAPEPRPAAPQPVPIVNQPRGSLACSHQYQYGRLCRGQPIAITFMAADQAHPALLPASTLWSRKCRHQLQTRKQQHCTFIR